MPNDNKISNLPIEAQDETISADDFKLVDSNNRVHEEKFQTRPTTFFKDCLKRFSKNKSSVVASVILGLLLVLSFAIPVLDKNDLTQPHPEMIYLEPKLFDKEKVGFWNGTKKWTKIPVDTGVNGFEETNKEENWWPNPDRFKRNAITEKQFSDITYTNGESRFGKEGYVHIGYYENISDSQKYVDFKTRPFDNIVDINNDNIYLTTFDTYDLDKLKLVEGDSNKITLPENYVLGKVGINFCYQVTVGEKIEVKSIELVEPKEVYSIGSKVTSMNEPELNLTDLLKNKLIEQKISDTTFEKAYIAFRMPNLNNKRNTCSLIRSIQFKVTGNVDLKKEIEITNFTDATECVIRSSTEEDSSKKNKAFWVSTGLKNIHLSKIVYCSFVYDSYEAAFGVMKMISIPINKLLDYSAKKWIRWNVVAEDDPDTEKWHFAVNDYAILDTEKSPIVEFLNVECNEDNGEIYVDAMVSYYRYYGYDKMPRFLMGTDKAGYDMLKYVFDGLKTSLLLGFITFIVCFLFGLLWGSVSGYFGGTVDLVMERFTDILSGVPWIVVMTLAIIKLGSNFWTFVLALCLTGWIGTASTARTQFYRFRGREYVLASRTLGANDARLIAKHILPNAMGTIITSAVLMIPSVIFSEATISYLGLGLKNLSSLGVILSNNQSELTTNSYLLIFPSVVIALLMISFNLFGNGLRDAVNPSLKGED